MSIKKCAYLWLSCAFVALCHQLFAEENMGFFYEVYAGEDSTAKVGYILGIIHPIPKKHVDILNFNSAIREAFEESTTFLPQVNFMQLNGQIAAYTKALIESRLAVEEPVTESLRKHSDEVFATTTLAASFDLQLLKMAEAKIAAGKPCKIMNLESLETYLLGIADNFFDPPILPENLEEFLCGCADAWKRGDSSFLENGKISVGEITQNFNNTSLFKARKKLIAESIDYLAKTNDGPFFAFCGASFLFGEASVLEALNEKGYRLVRK